MLQMGTKLCPAWVQTSELQTITKIVGLMDTPFTCQSTQLMPYRIEESPHDTSIIDVAFLVLDN